MKNPIQESAWKMTWEEDRKVDEWVGCGFATEIARGDWQ